MSPVTVGIIGLVVLVIILFLRLPVGFTFFLVGLLGFSYLVSLPAGLSLIAQEFYNNFTVYMFTTVPMFILMGFLAFEAGISTAVFEAAYAWIGHLRGGLALTTIAASAALGAVSASEAATAPTMTAVAYPAMKRYKYDPSLATGSIAAGSILGIMIPPSVVLIIYGILTENAIALLFLAGIVPGIMLMLLFMAAIYLQIRRNPNLGPAGPRTSWRTKFAMLGGGTIEMLIIFLAVIGSLAVGICTPTEAGALGVAAILVVSLARRKLTFQGFNKALEQTVQITAFVFVCIAGLFILGRFLAVSQIPAQLAAFVVGLDIPRVVIMGGILLIYFVSGFIIEPTMLVMLTIPIFYPLVMSLGYDPIWYGIITVCVVGMGGITPPVGMIVYFVGGVAKEVPLSTIFRGVWPFVGAILVGVVFLMAFPQIATFLPDLLMPHAGG